MEEIVEPPLQPFQLITDGFVVRSEVRSMMGSLDGPPQVQLDGRTILGGAPGILLRLVERFGEYEVGERIFRVTLDHEPAKRENSIHGLPGLIELTPVALVGGCVG
jgi:hypothetical protein